MPGNYGQGYGGGYPQQPQQQPQYPQQPQQTQPQYPQQPQQPQQPMQGMPPQQMGGQPYYGGYPQGGQQMPMGGQYGYPNGQMPKKGLGTGAIVGIALGGVAILGLILFLALRPSGDGNGGRDLPDDTDTTTTGRNGGGDDTSSDNGGTTIVIGGDGDTRATGTSDNGGWVTYDTPEAAAQDIGYALEIPSEAFGAPATDFLVRTKDGQKFLWYEYWDDVNSPLREIGSVEKMKDHIPPVLGTDENEHQVPRGDSFVIICGNDEETLCVWMEQDEAGDIWGYAVHFYKQMTDDEMLEFIAQVR